MAADHPLHPGRGHNLADGGEHVLGVPALLGQHEPERLREEAVAGQDRHVLAEGDVAGGLPAPQDVVVHRGKVVMDERVRVDHLDGGRERQDMVGRPAQGLCGG